VEAFSVGVIDVIADQQPDCGVTLRGEIPLKGDGMRAMRLMPKIWKANGRRTYRAAVAAAPRLVKAAAMAGAEHPERCAATAVFYGLLMNLTHTHGARFAKGVVQLGNAEESELTVHVLGFEWDVALCQAMRDAEVRNVLIDQYAEAVCIVTRGAFRALAAGAGMSDRDGRFLYDVRQAVESWSDVAKAAFLLRGLLWQCADAFGMRYEITDGPMFRQRPRGGRPVGLSLPVLQGALGGAF